MSISTGPLAVSASPRSSDRDTAIAKLTFWRAITPWTVVWLAARSACRRTGRS